MSCTTTIKAEIKNVNAMKRAAEQIRGATFLGHQKNVRFFSSNESGVAVQLPGWRYPIVADLESGKLKMDHYNWHWGSESDLNQFLQKYVVEAAVDAAAALGYSVEKTELPDGEVRCRMFVGGGDEAEGGSPGMSTFSGGYGVAPSGGGI